ncbi:hypothetical protein F5X99DRAFT_105361 [Biscogniauxia marginata]|nr:hypothetical protein F5X99DRAFT_105361 [Biscogniauxia marginata]
MALNKEYHATERPRKFAASLVLKIFIVLLMVDSIIELSFISSMVAWLNRTVTQNDFLFNFNGSTHVLAGVPQNLLVDQGHTSNGAAGTAFVLIGLGGIVALLLRSVSERRTTGFGVFGRYFYYLWVVLNIPALLLSIGALGYVFAVTNARQGQTIDVSQAASLNGRPYPLDSWTPQNWFSAVLQLDLVERRDEILSHLYVMRGWQYNLIPMFFIQLGETIVAVWDCFSWRQQAKRMAYNPGY